MRILVTGAAGFLGGHLSSALERAGHEVVRVDLPGRIPRIPPRSSPCDISDRNEVRAVLLRLEPDVLVHLAAVPRGLAGPAGPAPGETATRALLETLAGRFGSLVLAGSSAVYGAVPPEDLPVSESRTPAPTGDYGRAHLRCEQLCRDCAAAAGFRLAVMRMFNLVGPGQDPVMLVPQVARKLALVEAGRDPGGALFEGGIHTRRDYVDVGDAAGAYLAILEKSVPDVDAVNVCSGVSVPGTHVVTTLCSLFGTGTPVFPEPSRPLPGEVTDLPGNPALARSLLGWSASTKLEESLARVCEDWRSRVRTGRA